MVQERSRGRGRPIVERAVEPTPDRSRGVYGISVAADLVGTGVQNLRAYERRGLLSPDRTDGGTRLYSEEDLARLRRIVDLLGAGVNLAGVELILGLEDDNATLHDRNSRLRADLRDARQHR